ncbi:carboxypeptidase-like regulatory domain-containing protein [Hymenobacter sp. B81]|uniref:carboxypeptidase-like regulatory domain-containing protein n=1 Tax=Hymenobacter sp. B81 TaxID=3344878 RepID=UPI0037DD423F
MPYVSLDSPCPQPWQHLTPTDAGRYCSSCAKVVVDFTAMSDAEVLAFLADNQHTATCGRFRASQLSRPLQPQLPVAAPTAQAWAAAALALVLSSCADQPPLPSAPETPAVSQKEFVVRGRVTDRDSGQPLAGAYITVLHDTTRQVRSQADGTFTMPLPEQLRGTKLVVAGMLEPQRWCLARVVKAEPEVLVSLQPMPEESIAMGEVQLSSYPGYQPGDTLFPPKLTTIRFIPPDVDGY